MEVGGSSSRRKGTASSSSSSSSRNGVGVVAGSVWESRIKVDEVKGGIKVFNGEENDEPNSATNVGNHSSGPPQPPQAVVDKRLSISPKQGLVGLSGKRKTWKSESFEGNPIQIARQRSESSKNLDEQSKELSVSSEEMKKTPVQIMKKKRPEVISSNKESNGSDDLIEKSPIERMKTRSMIRKISGDSNDASEKNTVQIRKVKSESVKVLNDDEIEISHSGLRKVKSESVNSLKEPFDGNPKSPLPLGKAKSLSSKDFDENGSNLENSPGKIEKNSMELRKKKLEESKVMHESSKNFDGFDEVPDKSPVGVSSTKSDDDCKDFGICEEKLITTNISKVDQTKSVLQLEMVHDPEVDADGVEEEWDEAEEEEFDEEIEVEIEQKSLVVKEISKEQKPKKVVVEEKKVPSRNERPVATSSIVKKLSFPAPNNANVHSTPPKSKPIPVADEFQRVPRSQGRLQSLVDLVMWRDVSKSALVFGLGTFIIISSTYTKDLNISLISVLSYLGLVYLAAIFLFRSFISRGSIGMGERRQDYVVGEEEAMWVMKLILPYINECLLKIRALFSGDPATTMKMAVLLFVLARCGSSITIWKMAKLGFFGVFTVPKICSSYSTQLTAYGKFWIRRFGDAWESCTHKKAVAFAIFTVVWNLSSVVARIWAVFLLFVAFRYYQHSLLSEDWAGEGPTMEENCTQTGKAQLGVQRRGRRPTSIELRKQKKTI